MMPSRSWSTAALAREVMAEEEEAPLAPSKMVFVGADAVTGKPCWNISYQPCTVMVPVLACLPLSRAICVVLDVIEGLRSLVHHQTNRVGKVAACALRVPRGVDHVNLSLDLYQAVNT